MLWFGDSLVSGFAVLAALLLGAALALPAILEWVLVLGQRSARRRARDLVLGRQPPAAFGIVAGVDGAVAGARGQCRRRHHGRNLQPDLYRLARRTAGGGRLHQRSDDAQATEIKAWLRQRPEVEAILPGGRADTQIDGAPVEILGLADHATYRDHWPLLQSGANAWIRLRPGDAGFVSEQLARRLKSRLGDRIEVPAPGGNWTLEVVGIYADYGNPKGQIAVNFAALTRRFPEIPLTRLGLRVAPAAVPALIVGAAGQVRAGWPQPRSIRRR